jgi:hypothetical protein
MLDALLVEDGEKSHINFGMYQQVFHVFRIWYADIFGGSALSYGWGDPPPEGYSRFVSVR